MASLKTGERVIFDLVGAQALGVVNGVLTYVTAGGTIMGVPIDMRRRKLSGAPVQLVSDVAINTTTGLARASLAANGTLLYQSGTQSSQAIAVGLDGSARPLLAESREYAFPRLSPDGRRLAIAVGASDRRDVWLFELNTQTMTRLTSEGASNDRPEWTSDGKRVLYRSDRSNRSAIWTRPADLSAEATQLVGGPKVDIFEAVMSPDMRNVAYQLDTTGADIFYRAVSGDTAPHVVSNNDKAIETMPRLSPDGRWVAFITDESGRNEVVVQPFPGPGGRVQVSAGGGTEPVWSRDGRRLFYRGDGHLMAARLAPGEAFAVVARDTLFADTYQFAANPHANFDVMADGAHFVFLKAASEGSMIVVTNLESVGSGAHDGKPMTAPLRDKRPAKDDPTIAERLRAHRTLSVAPQAELDWLIERGTLGYYLPGDEMVIKGEPVNTLYIVLKGRVAYLARVRRHAAQGHGLA